MQFPRFDRLITLNVVYPIINKTVFLRKRIRIPILMYHSISENAGRGVNPYYETTTTPEIFVKQMKYLYDNKYSIINLPEVIKLLKSPESHKDVEKRDLKYAVITFDDGFRDFYTDAYPVLQQYNYTATVFLPTAFINNNRSKFKGRDCLTWLEIKELFPKGIVFGSHTVNHPQLRWLSKRKIEEEIQKSKETIESYVGEQIESFSYPFAFPEEDRNLKQFIRDTLESNGYLHGVCTTIGTAMECDDEFFLKRIPVNSYDDIKLFRAKLNGAYDWLNKPQYLYKFIRRRLL